MTAEMFLMSVDLVTNTKKKRATRPPPIKKIPNLQHPLMNNKKSLTLTRGEYKKKKVNKTITG